MFNYFYGNEAEQYTFYRIPKVLFTEPTFKSISCEAKVLYGLMLDRMSLSIKNNWKDEENRIYIIFTIENVMQCLSCGNQKAVKILQELDVKKGIGLIEKKRQGLNKPDLIYVKDYSTPLKYRKCENHISGSVKITSQEVLKSHAINTDINKTNNHSHSESISELNNDSFEKEKRIFSNVDNINQVKSSQIFMEEKKEIEQTRQGQDLTHKMNMEISNLKKEKEIEELKNQIAKLKRDAEQIIEITDLQKYEFNQDLIKNNVKYNNVKNFYSDREEIVKLFDSFIDIMADTMSSNKKTVRIASQDISSSLVSKKFEQITQEQLFFAINQYMEYSSRTEVKFPKQYILTCIYNASFESIPSSFTNRVYSGKFLN